MADRQREHGGRRWLGRAAGLALVIALSGCASLCSSAPKREVRPEPYSVVFATTPPVIDGKLDDAVWKDAVRLEPLYEYGKFGARTDIADVRLAWDAKYLYYAVTVRDADIYVAESARDAILCRADVVELFVKPPVRDRYEFELYEFEFNVWDAIWDIHYPGYGCAQTDRYDKLYNPDILIKSTVRGTINDWTDVDEGCTIEVAIPWAAFERAAPGGVKPGDVWKFNASGYDFSVYRRSAFLYTSVDGNTIGFNQYEDYPSMVFLAPR